MLNMIEFIIHYPFHIVKKADPVVLMQQIRQLTAESRLLKSRVKICFEVKI